MYSIGTAPLSRGVGLRRRPLWNSNTDRGGSRDRLSRLPFKVHLIPTTLYHYITAIASIIKAIYFNEKKNKNIFQKMPCQTWQIEILCYIMQAVLITPLLLRDALCFPASLFLFAIKHPPLFHFGGQRVISSFPAPYNTACNSVIFNVYWIKENSKNPKYKKCCFKKAVKESTSFLRLRTTTDIAIQWKAVSVSFAVIIPRLHFRFARLKRCSTSTRSHSSI